MNAVAPETRDVQLRCHSCSHGVGSAEVAMRCVGLFRALFVPRVRTARADELRFKCKHCGWVNIFHPLTQRSDHTTVELK